MSDAPPQRPTSRRRAAAAAVCVLAPVALAAGLATPGGAQTPSEPPYALPTPAPQPADDPPQPSLRRRAVLVPVIGRVRWRPRNGGYRVLTGARAVRLGSVVDARRGRVRVIVSRGGGRRWRAVFHAGRFRITQTPPGTELTTTVRLVGGNFERRCAASAAGEASADARTARKRRRRAVRRLWGDGHGRFRTRGRHSAATVRGTRWLVADRCDGTVTRVARGEVEVEELGATAPTGGSPPGDGGSGGAPGSARPETQRGAAPPEPIRLRAGESHVARPRG